MCFTWIGNTNKNFVDMIMNTFALIHYPDHAFQSASFSIGSYLLFLI